MLQVRRSSAGLPVNGPVHDARRQPADGCSLHREGLQLPCNNYGVPKIGRDEMDAVLGSDGLSREAAELARQGARAERAAIGGRLVLECLSLK